MFISNQYHRGYGNIKICDLIDTLRIRKLNFSCAYQSLTAIGRMLNALNFILDEDKRRLYAPVALTSYTPERA
jgi:hypothetical protein